jgi:group I intron endonuclease
MNNKNNMNIMPVKSYLNASINEFDVYKDNKEKSGIYRWINLITGKFYVGSSICLSKRLYHYYYIDKFKRIGSKDRSLINKAILKYGISSFQLDILEYCESDVLIKREQYYIDLLMPEYNICKTAGSILGLRFKHSKETKFKISIANKGKYHTEETRLKISIANKGNKNPMFEKTFTEETKLKMSLNKIGDKNPMFGKKHTLVTKERISLALKGKKLSMETGIKLKGRKHSVETRNKISAKLKGRNVSLEVRAKISTKLKRSFVLVTNIKDFSIKEYYSVRDVARDLNVSFKTVYIYVNTGKLLKNYFFVNK